MLLKTVKQTIILKNPASCIKVASDSVRHSQTLLGRIPMRRNPVLEVQSIKPGNPIWRANLDETLFAICNYRIRSSGGYRRGGLDVPIRATQSGDDSGGDTGARRRPCRIA